MLFAAADYDVMLYDIDQKQLTGAMQEIRTQISLLESQKLLRGSLSAEEQFKNISTTDKLTECVSGAGYIQVCKRTVQTEYTQKASKDTTVTIEISYIHTWVIFMIVFFLKLI